MEKNQILVQRREFRAKDERMDYQSFCISFENKLRNYGKKASTVLSNDEAI